MSVSKNIAVNGETKLKLGAASLTVRTREISAPKQNGDGIQNQISQCTGGRMPCLLTEFFEVRVNGKLIIMPYSAWGDLGDMGAIKLEHAAKNYILTVYGGDASVAYIAKIYFNADRVIQRVIAPGEDSTQPSERTTYYNPKRFE